MESRFDWSQSVFNRSRGGNLPFHFMLGAEPCGHCPLRFLAQDWRAESWALSSEGAAVLLGNGNISRPEQDLVPSGLARAQAGEFDLWPTNTLQMATGPGLRGLVVPWRPAWEGSLGCHAGWGLWSQAVCGEGQLCHLLALSCLRKAPQPFSR